MPKYIATCSNEFLDTSLNSKLRYNNFAKTKPHLLQHEKDPNSRIFIFVLYVKKYEFIKQALEENPRIDSFDDEDIDNVFLQDLEEYIMNGQFKELMSGFVKHKIAEQCKREGREVPSYISGNTDATTSPLKK